MNLGKTIFFCLTAFIRNLFRIIEIHQRKVPREHCKAIPKRFVLQGRRFKAQGIALGRRIQFLAQALKGRRNGLVAPSPFQGFAIGALSAPRALPWALLRRPFRANHKHSVQTVKKCTVRDENFRDVFRPIVTSIGID